VTEYGLWPVQDLLGHNSQRETFTRSGQRQQRAKLLEGGAPLMFVQQAIAVMGLRRPRFRQYGHVVGDFAGAVLPHSRVSGRTKIGKSLGVELESSAAIGVKPS